MYGAEFFVCSFEHVAFVSGWRVGLCSSHVSFQKSSNFVMERGCEVCVLDPARNAAVLHLLGGACVGGSMGVKF